MNGWSNGFAFVLSFLAPVWTINAFDSTVHISEEAANARTAVPFAIVASTLMAGVLGWGKLSPFSDYEGNSFHIYFIGMNMAFVFNMGKDMAAILSNPIGQPLATVKFA